MPRGVSGQERSVEVRYDHHLREGAISKYKGIVLKHKWSYQVDVESVATLYAKNRVNCTCTSVRAKVLYAEFTRVSCITPHRRCSNDYTTKTSESRKVALLPVPSDL